MDGQKLFHWWINAFIRHFLIFPETSCYPKYLDDQWCTLFKSKLLCPWYKDRLLSPTRYLPNQVFTRAGGQPSINEIIFRHWKPGWSYSKRKNQRFRKCLQKLMVPIKLYIIWTIGNYSTLCQAKHSSITTEMIGALHITHLHEINKNHVI